MSILLALKEPKTLDSIASSLKVSRQDVSYHVKTLIQHDYLKRGLNQHKDHFLYSFAALPFLNAAKQARLSDYHRVGESFATDDKVQSKIRLHGVHIKYSLETPLPQTTLDRVVHIRKFMVRPILLRGHTDYSIRFGPWYQNATGIIRTRSFTIEGIQLEIPPGISVEAAHDWYMHEINGTVERIAARLEKEIPGFRLKRSDRDPNMFSGEVIQRHIAFENHPIAQAVPEGFKFEVKDPVDGKPRIIVDHSHGPPELETVHNKLSLDDMVQLQANTFVLATNDLKEVFAEVGRVQSTGQDQLDQLRETVQMLVTGKLGGNPV